MSFKAIPTTNVPETVARTLQLIQKTNSWTKHVYLEQNKDSQGKTRSRFCLRGAVRAATAGSTEAAEKYPTGRRGRTVNATRKAIEKTLNANPTRYGLNADETENNDMVGFNDRSTTEHKHVLRVLRDTLVRVTPSLY